MKLNQGLTTFAFLAMMGIGCTSPTATQVEFDTEGVAVESDSALRERVGERYLITFRNFRQSKATLRGSWSACRDDLSQESDGGRLCSCSRATGSQQ